MWKALDKNRIYKSSADKGLQWHFGPADSPWNQGAVESLIKSAKKILKLCIADERLSPTEFTTVCYEVSNLLIERPLGVIPGQDSDINILTPNMLLLGRATGDSIIDSHCGSESSKARYCLVNHISQKFWERWMELYAPTLMTQTKWHQPQRNLQVGDIVLVCDSNALRSHYHLAQVREVYPDEKGIVRKVSLRYKNYKVGEKVYAYAGAKDVTVTRSVHRLALLVPVEEK